MRTFAMIKPDAVRLKFTGPIIARLEQTTDLRVVEIRMMHLTTAQAKEFYREHEDKPFFSPLVDFSTSGPLVCMVLEGDDAVNRWRSLMGATNPQKATPGTLRAEFGMGMPNNAVHGSDSPESAAREIAVFKNWA